MKEKTTKVSVIVRGSIQVTEWANTDCCLTTHIYVSSSSLQRLGKGIHTTQTLVPVYSKLLR